MQPPQRRPARGGLRGEAGRHLDVVRMLGPSEAKKQETYTVIHIVPKQDTDLEHLWALTPPTHVDEPNTRLHWPSGPDG